MSMSTKKTVRVPLAADGVPLVMHIQQPERTREIAVDKEILSKKESRGTGERSAPRDVVDDDITVPVHSSIESSLTFEVLRRQSTNDDEGKK
jgi:hypothetical protein